MDCLCVVMMFILVGCFLLVVRLFGFGVLGFKVFITLAVPLTYVSMISLVTGWVMWIIWVGQYSSWIVSLCDVVVSIYYDVVVIIYSYYLLGYAVCDFCESHEFSYGISFAMIS